MLLAVFAVAGRNGASARVRGLQMFAPIGAGYTLTVVFGDEHNLIHGSNWLTLSLDHQL